DVLPAVHGPGRRRGGLPPPRLRGDRTARGDVVDPGAAVLRVRDGAGLRDPARVPAGGGVQPRDGAGHCSNRSESSGSPGFRSVRGARISSSSESAFARGTVPLRLIRAGTPAWNSRPPAAVADHSRPSPSTNR